MGEHVRVDVGECPRSHAGGPTGVAGRSVAAEHHGVCQLRAGSTCCLVFGGGRLCFRPQGRAHAPGHVLLTESAEDSSVSPASTTSTIIRRVKAGLGLEATSRRKAAGSGRESCRSPRGPQAGDVGSRRGAWAEAGGSVGAPAEGTRRGRAWKVGSPNSRDIIPSRRPTA